MQPASEIEVREYSDSVVAPSMSRGEILAHSRTSVFVFIVVLGAALRLYGLASYSLVGDEYNSLVEATHLGLNWNSIIYSSVMHFWIQFGSSEIWLRLPAALFGIATIPVLYKAGAELGGYKTGVAAGLLAATSPFNLYHSQEVRFYSLFMFAAAAFLLATIHYVESKRPLRNRVWVAGAGLFLLISHFVGAIALCAQAAATFLATKRRKMATMLIVAMGIPVLIFGLPLLPPVRAGLLYLYRTFGNAAGPDISLTPVSLISVAKIAFAGYTFLFGYHVYPMRLILVGGGAALALFLLVCGVTRLAVERRWASLAFIYTITLAGVYFVLDSLGGRVASGVAPRHVAFVWPVFILLLAIGSTWFRKMVFVMLIAGMLLVNTVSVAARWSRSWSYGATTDYRAAADLAARSTTPTTAIVYGHRAGAPVEFYFPRNVPRLNLFSFQQLADRSELAYDRLIFISDDWREDYRRPTNEALTGLQKSYTCSEGRVDYPLFEYVCDRSVPVGSLQLPTDGAGRQLRQPLSVYGIEFQDLRLPISVPVGALTLRVNGAAELPSAKGERSIMIPAPPATKRVILLTNVTYDQPLPPGTTVAELVVENTTGVVQNWPLKLGAETAPWDKTCDADAPCKTVFQWHKRIMIAGQNAYPGAYRDFQAGIHATTFDLPGGAPVRSISIQFIAPSGHFYVWAIAVS